MMADRTNHVTLHHKDTHTHTGLILRQKRNIHHKHDNIKTVL